MILIIALFAAIIAFGFFAWDFAKSNWGTLTSAGLACMALSLVAFFFKLVQDAGTI